MSFTSWSSHDAEFNSPSISSLYDSYGNDSTHSHDYWTQTEAEILVECFPQNTDEYKFAYIESGIGILEKDINDTKKLMCSEC